MSMKVEDLTPQTWFLFHDQLYLRIEDFFDREWGDNYVAVHYDSSRLFDSEYFDVDVEVIGIVDLMKRLEMKK